MNLMETTQWWWHRIVFGSLSVGNGTMAEYSPLSLRHDSSSTTTFNLLIFAPNSFLLHAYFDQHYLWGGCNAPVSSNVMKGVTSLCVLLIWILYITRHTAYAMLCCVWLWIGASGFTRTLYTHFPGTTTSTVPVNQPWTHWPRGRYESGF